MCVLVVPSPSPPPPPPPLAATIALRSACVTMDETRTDGWEMGEIPIGNAGREGGGRRACDVGRCLATNATAAARHRDRAATPGIALSMPVAAAARMAAPTRSRRRCA